MLCGCTNIFLNNNAEKPHFSAAVKKFFKKFIKIVK